MERSLESRYGGPMTDQAAPPAPDAMQRFRRWAAWAVALSTLGYLAYALTRGFNEVASELAAYPWWTLGPVLLLTLVNYGLRYLKWHYLLGRLGIHIPHRHDGPIFLAGLAMVISPAKAGEVVKPYLVGVISGAPMARTIPVLVAERGTDGIAVVILAAIGVTTYAADKAWLVLVALGVIGAALAVIAIEPLARGVLALIGSLPVVGRFGERLEVAYDATRTVLAPGPLLLTIGLSLVAWFAECVGAWLVFLALDMPASLDMSTFLYAFSTVFGAPSPGGLGMADVALAEGALGLMDVTAGQALAGTLLIRVATLWFGVILGAIALMRMEHVIADATRA